jgi:hypothetical protein
MSALGHKQTFAVQKVMSALHRNAECCVLVAVGVWLALNWSGCPPYRPHDPDQQDRTDEPGNQVADPSP